MPYSSDLEFWLRDSEQWMKGPMPDEKDCHGRKDFITAVKKLAKKTNQSKWESPFTQACAPVCNGGRDGGLYTGETVLHMAIVQNRRNRSYPFPPPPGSHLPPMVEYNFYHF